MNTQGRYVLVAEDDEDDFSVLRDAFAQGAPEIGVEWVKDGEELTDHLKKNRAPALVLLDLNMPKKDGREALKEIKADRALCHIPIVVLTTSSSREDVLATYGLGISAYLQKPLSFNELTARIKVFADFWFRIATLPDTTV
jgi:DNA-binding response OmpR family regulator